MQLQQFLRPNFLLAVAVLLALLTGFFHTSITDQIALSVSELFINLLKLVSLPIIFLSIVSTVTGMSNIQEFKSLGKKVVKYTLLTTLIASTTALVLFVLIDPVKTALNESALAVPEQDQHGYFYYLLQVIPSNFLQPFLENHVIGVLFLAILFSLAVLALPDQQRSVLHPFFASLFAAIMKVTSWIVRWMPLGIWSFITLFIGEMRAGLEIKSLALYLGCVVGANLIQGILVLPLLIKSKGISPIKLFKAMFPALSLAFFTKSSNATLPLAMRCAEENMGIPRKISSFTLPLCTTINMNGCAAFILTTVLFVSMSHGMVFSPVEMILWIFISTIAAVGNAGVPMGCYFLSSAFLAAMNVPLNILGIILPFYTLIDMLETSINVWSDSCVVSIVHQELSEKEEDGIEYATTS